MAQTRTAWTERRARLALERLLDAEAAASGGGKAVLVADATGQSAVANASTMPTKRDLDEAGRDQVLRAAVNELQYKLLTSDAQADVYGLALERLVSASGADRVCAFANKSGADERATYVLYAEEYTSPELSLLGTGAADSLSADELPPGLYERLAHGEPFASMTEFLPRKAAARLAAQAVEAVLFLPLFVGGQFHGFLRFDHCDHARLWGEDEIGILLLAAGSVSAAIERQQVVSKLVQRSHELAALLSTSRSITSSIDYEVVLHEVACAAAGALGCPESVIWEYVESDQTALFRVLYQRDPEPGVADSLVGTTYPMADYPGGMDAVRQGVVAQQSLSDADLSAADREAMTTWGEKTWLTVPLVYGREILGMMVLVETEEERRFSDEEVRMATLVGEQAAAALHNARLHHREEDQHRWMAALAEATRVISSRLDKAQLLRDVGRLATEALLIDESLTYEAGEEDGAFVLQTTPAAGNAEAAGRERRGDDTGEAPSGVTEALRRGEVVLQALDDAALDPDVTARLKAAGERTVLWVPFRIEGETLGAMRLAVRSDGRRLTDAELSFARALGEHAAIALNNARLYAQIEDQATKDGLTGLANHRHFYDRLTEEVARARRTNEPLSLLMLDIDDFKRLNDTCGHPSGDEVLRRIGALLREALRRGGDLAARYGGEEFCVILPHTPAGQRSDGADEHAGQAEGAVALAERLRGRIAACEFPIGLEGAPVHVTVSIGVASLGPDTQRMDELVARADAALYAAKRTGKDRVQVS